MRIQHHPPGLAVHGDGAYIEARVVVQHRADARKDGGGPGAPDVAVGPGRVAGDPLAAAIGQRRAAIQRGRHLQPHPGALAHHAGQETDVEFA